MTKQEMRDLNRLLRLLLQDPDVQRSGSIYDGANLTYAFTSAILDHEARTEERTNS